MRRNIVWFLSAALLLVGLGVALAQQKDTKAQSGDAASSAPIPAADAEKKNPVKSTPEGLAEAKRLYKYHCAMCHGEQGDGKGDLAVEMKLELKDWRNPDSLAKMTDGELFYIVTNGRGKMTGGEGDRTKETTRWNLVNLVRSFSVKAAPAQ
ncbi:MAG TPA: c-type cytochrome [Candidatus Acidoferrum sp.]|jgi:mono/diheme cytochrome c family protein